jgi:uncharacterized protein YaiI (UPF0178 family)
MKVLVDADACPQVVKDLLFRACLRLDLECLLVANQPMRVPLGGKIRSIVVDAGPDEADKHIVEILEPWDVVITADLPLADHAIKKGGCVLDPRGVVLDAQNIAPRLASRDLMADLRAQGVETSGPKPYGPKDKQEFANQLDRLLQKLIREGR